MLRYCLLFFPIAVLAFYLYSFERTESREEITVGDAYLISISTPANRKAYFKRISANQFMFTFIAEGEAAEIGELPSAKLLIGQELRLVEKNCVLSFKDISDNSHGRIACGNFSESDFEATLLKMDNANFQLHRTDSDDTVKMLGELENLSDEILELTSDIVLMEDVIGKLRKGSFDIEKKELDQVTMVSSSSRDLLLRTSIEGQEIALATRLLDEEGKIYLGVQKFNKNMLETPSSVEVAQSPTAMPTILDVKTPSKSEEWWKNID